MTKYDKQKKLKKIKKKRLTFQKKFDTMYKQLEKKQHEI